MRREELGNAINGIGDDLIEDAGKIRNKKPSLTVWTRAAAACAALLILGVGAFAAIKAGVATKSEDKLIYTEGDAIIDSECDKSMNGSDLYSLKENECAYGTESLVCHSENEEIEISVSGYKLHEGFPQIDVLWKYTGSGEFDLNTYCNLKKQTENGWEDCRLDTAFSAVLYVLKAGGEMQVQYYLYGAELTEGETYRLYLAGFEETDFWVDFVYLP